MDSGRLIANYSDGAAVTGFSVAEQQIVVGPVGKWVSAGVAAIPTTDVSGFLIHFGSPAIQNDQVT